MKVEVQKHYVTFFSPGTLVHEQNTEEIDSWDVDKAKEMARRITQRHNAKPFGFQFTTRGREEKDLDSKEIASSNMYFLGGDIFTLQDVIDRNDDKDKTLISNMKNNGIEKVIENNNSWHVCTPLQPEDVVLDY